MPVNSDTTGRDKPMKGMKCKCGFATVSEKVKCPRCGKAMKPAEWPDFGKVLSFANLQVFPEGLEDPYNLALVAIDKKGPKVPCWTSGKLEEDDEVSVTDRDGKYFCALKTELKFGLETDSLKPN